MKRKNVKAYIVQYSILHFFKSAGGIASEWQYYCSKVFYFFTLSHCIFLCFRSHRDAWTSYQHRHLQHQPAFGYPAVQTGLWWQNIHLTLAGRGSGNTEQIHLKPSPFLLAAIDLSLLFVAHSDWCYRRKRGVGHGPSAGQWAWCTIPWGPGSEPLHVLQVHPLWRVEFWDVFICSAYRLCFNLPFGCRFRMRQVNIVGTSPPSQPSRKIQTLQAPPDIAPANITLRTASETSLWLRWVVRMRLGMRSICLRGKRYETDCLFVSFC